MAYLDDHAIAAMQFRSVGKNVRISDKCSIYNCDQISIGDNSRIDDFCIVSGNISIGRNVHIAPHCLVAGGECGIRIDDFAGLAYFVQVFSQSDDYSGASLTNPTVPAEFKREIKKAVAIGRHAIIGAGSMVFPGVDLAEGCSVGAMSLVRKSTEPWGIYTGNPAKRIKDRKRDLLDMEKAYIAHYG